MLSCLGSCCGKVGHNIKQCPSPAAKELLHLQAAVKGFLEGAPQKRFKGRLPVKKNTKSEDYRKEAKEAYGTYNRRTRGSPTTIYILIRCLGFEGFLFRVLG